jgi:signal transduction histidine kinase
MLCSGPAPHEFDQSGDPVTKAAGERERRAYLAQTRQELLALVTALVGYGEMLAEEARQLDLENVLPDLERILASDRDLLEPVDQLLDVEGIASRLSV